MSIGNHIKKLRLAQGLTLSEISIRTGIAKSYLSSIERDLKSNPSIHVLEKLAGVLKVDIQALLYQETDEKKEPKAIDSEWLDLIQKATELRISKEEFKQFIEFRKWQQDNQK